MRVAISGIVPGPRLRNTSVIMVKTLASVPTGVIAILSGWS